MGMFDKFNDSVIFNNPCPPGCENCCPLDIQLAYDPVTNVLTLTYIYDSATVVRTVNLTDLQEALTIGLSFNPVTNIITLAGSYNGAPFTSNVDTTHNHDLELTLDGTSIVLTGEHDNVQIQTQVDLSSIIGGNLSLSQVLINGNTSGANNINFDVSQGLVFSNTSMFKEGTTDGGNGGAKGVAQFCSLGYELKWEAGRLYVMGQDGFTIRWVLFQLYFAPSTGDDDTKGYIVGSRWTMDDGSTYICTDSTTGSAVWALQFGPVPTLAQVLASGNTANNQSIGDVDTLGFNLATTNIAGEGQMLWNDQDGTLDLGLKGGNLVLQLGQENIVRVVNKTTPLVTLLSSAYQAVIVSGATGQRLSVRLAKADSDTNSAGTIGLVAEDIAVNQEGFVCTVGHVREINTTGALHGETWNDGDVLYLSPFTFGAITNIKPVAPNHLIVIGYVEYAHAVHGKIYVKVDNGYELDELHNVGFSTTPVTGEVLSYITANNRWENKTLSSILGYTPVTNARTISTTSPLSGGGDLSANRTLSIQDAAADGVTKGAATFTTSDFNSTSGLISIDYTNGQSASGSNKGFLTSSDWTTFNGKQNALGYTPVPDTRTLTINGTTQDLSANRTFTISDPSGWNIIVLSANQDVTNTITPQDITEFQFSVVGGGHYMLEMDICWSGNNATADYMANFLVTAGVMRSYGIIIASDQTTTRQVTANNANSASFGSFNLVSTDIDFLMTGKIYFNFYCTLNATFKYQVRNATASAGAISRTWKGSILKYKRID